MAASPDVVKSFLVDLSSTIKHKAVEEFHKIQDFKRQRHSDTSVSLELRNEAYFSGLMKSSIYDLDSSVIASYFPVSQCLEGLKVLVESLFGARFNRIPVLPGESWHPDVTKLSLSHPQEGRVMLLHVDAMIITGNNAARYGNSLSEISSPMPVSDGLEGFASLYGFRDCSKLSRHTFFLNRSIQLTSLVVLIYLTIRFWYPFAT